MRLSRATLHRVNDGVHTPPYDREAMTPGIVHFGVGNFHRAHQAVVIDRLAQAGHADDWGIIGVGVREADAAMKNALTPQDCLYTLTTKDMSTQTTRIIGSILDILYAPDDPGAVVRLLADPQIRIVSLTITEGGYNYDNITGEFLWSTPDVAEDLTRPHSPRTVFGFITEGLRARRDAGIAPFTVMSCDNIQGNGHLAKEMFVSFAEKVDPSLAHWIDSQVSFPNSMVDRITPATTADDIAEAARLTGLDDQWPVVSETFFQWVLEDDFPTGRPPFEEAGVQLVDDVEPYELMKLRLLNASHQALAYFAAMKGYHFVHDAANDPDIQTLLRRFMSEEAEPTLRPIPGIDVSAYQRTLIERFQNLQVRDTVARLAQDASDRIPKWLVPIITERLAKGGEVTLSAAIVASWARYAEGIDESGVAFNLVDNLKTEVMARAAKHDTDLLAFVRNTAFFGNLANDKRFTTDYLDTLTQLRDTGAATTLGKLVNR